MLSNSEIKRRLQKGGDMIDNYKAWRPPIKRKYLKKRQGIDEKTYMKHYFGDEQEDIDLNELYKQTPYTTTKDAPRYNRQTVKDPFTLNDYRNDWYADRGKPYSTLGIGEKPKIRYPEGIIPPPPKIMLPEIVTEKPMTNSDVNIIDNANKIDSLLSQIKKGKKLKPTSKRINAKESVTVDLLGQIKKGLNLRPSTNRVLKQKEQETETLLDEIKKGMRLRRDQIEQDDDDDDDDDLFGESLYGETFHGGYTDAEYKLIENELKKCRKGISESYLKSVTMNWGYPGESQHTNIQPQYTNIQPQYTDIQPQYNWPIAPPPNALRPPSNVPPPPPIAPPRPSPSQYIPERPTPNEPIVPWTPLTEEQKEEKKEKKRAEKERMRQIEISNEKTAEHQNLLFAAIARRRRAIDGDGDRIEGSGMHNMNDMILNNRHYNMIARRNNTCLKYNI